MSLSNCLDWTSEMDIPKIKSVIPLEEKRLLVAFANGVQKIYDCNKLLHLDRFQPLKIGAFFKAVVVDRGGYGISWNEEVDLSEYELWTNGVEFSQSQNMAKAEEKN